MTYPKQYVEHISSVRYLMAICENCRDQADTSSDNKREFARRLAEDGWTVNAYGLLCPKCQSADKQKAKCETCGK